MNFQSEIAEIMTKYDDNRSCIDCSAPNPVFTSLNNAVFLCENCANRHKALGPNISLVKSLINTQFSEDEINLLRVGGNYRFKILLNEYGITRDQDKDFKYHLKIVEYHRKLLVAEANIEKNSDEYLQLVENRPTPDRGLQIMESANESIIQALQNQNKNEIEKDASELFGKVTGFFNSIGDAINETVHKYGIDQKVTGIKNKVNETAKNFVENHPTIQKAEKTTREGIKTAGNYVTEGINKIVQSESVQNVSNKISEVYQGIANSETVRNLSKKAEEQYINLKQKAKETFSNNNNQQN